MLRFLTLLRRAVSGKFKYLVSRMVCIISYQEEGIQLMYQHTLDAPAGDRLLYTNPGSFSTKVAYADCTQCMLRYSVEKEMLKNMCNLDYVQCSKKKQTECTHHPSSQEWFLATTKN